MRWRDWVKVRALGARPHEKPDLSVAWERLRGFACTGDDWHTLSWESRLWAGAKTRPLSTDGWAVRRAGWHIRGLREQMVGMGVEDRAGRQPDQPKRSDRQLLLDALISLLHADEAMNGDERHSWMVVWHLRLAEAALRTIYKRHAGLLPPQPDEIY